MRTAKVSAVPKPPKVPWYAKLANSKIVAAIGNAIGQAKFGGN